jgi:hypothetical protein
MHTVDEAWRNNKFAPEQLLWSAVLETALSDALTHRDPVEKERAIRWFRDGGQHFRMVCDLANYEPSFVQKNVLSLIKADTPNSIH